MNKWVPEQIAATGLTGPMAAENMTREIGEGYNRFTLYKMTTTRKVTLLEAQALSRATGYPLPDEDGDEREQAMGYGQRRARLSPKRREILDSILADLEAAEAIDARADQSPADSPDAGA